MPGPSGLPHFNNSTAARENYEPLYLNQFEVLITPPSVVIATDDILLEQVKKITGLPELTPIATVEQFYKFAKRTYAAAKPEDTTAELEIDFEVNLNKDNEMYTYNALRQWSDIIFDPLTGKMGTKDTYTGLMTVIIYNKAQTIYRQFDFKSVYMMEPLKEMELEYLSEDIYVLTAKFKSDHYKETREGVPELS